MASKNMIFGHPDLAYITLPPHGGAFFSFMPFVFLLKILRIRPLYHIHGKGIGKFSEKSALFRILMRWVSRNADFIILSERLVADSKMFFPANRVYIIPNFVRSTDVSVVEKQVGKAQILFLSNLVISKGPVILLDALSILHERKAKFRATFTGAAHPPLTPETFQAMIDDRGLRDFVTFAGPVFGRAKQQLLTSSDIFAFPSYNDAFPLVVLEAMSAGLPVVATAEGAIPDMIESGVNGILVPHHDPLALADAIGVLLDNPGQRAAFGKAGRNKVMTDYSFEIFTERMSSLWSALA